MVMVELPRLRFLGFQTRRSLFSRATFRDPLQCGLADKWFSVTTLTLFSNKDSESRGNLLLVSRLFDQSDRA